MAPGENIESEFRGWGKLDSIGDHEEEGVLLYYQFVQIADPEKMKTWLFDMSASLGLLGRIRVAPDGINVTVGGKMKALDEHIQLVGANPLFQGTDFKLANGVGNVNNKVAAETGFTSLSARIVKELVTLGLPSAVEPPSFSMAGKHVTAQEFHKILQESAMRSEIQAERDSPSNGGSGVSLDNSANSAVSLNTLTVSPERGTGTTGEGSAATQSKELGGTAFPKKTVVVDARNIYETRIGKFRPAAGVEVMDPMVRQYSDLPKWIDDNEDHLRNNRILMYCTGGVRCEMASAYIRSKGTEFEDVSQLSGGIQRYLEAFSDGGYFSGKNFVFDHRLAVPSSNQEVVGSCLLCSSPFDDYSSRCRCSLCRMLVLICNACQVAAGQMHGGPNYICELCSEEKTSTTRGPVGSQHSEDRIASHEAGVPHFESRDEVRQRKLKILCLHGFRQSALSLKGRLNALRKKLRQHVEFVYVDAPHEVVCQHSKTSAKEETTSDGPGNNEDPSPADSFVDDAAGRVARKFSKKFAWLTTPTTVAGDAATGSPRGLVRNTVLATSCDHQGATPANAVTHVSESITRKPDFVAQRDGCDGQLRCATSASLEGEKDNSIATRDHAIDRAARFNHGATIPQYMQYRTQTAGWSRSWLHLKRVFTEQGPFDGVLGFSQGAAIAAALCIRRSIIISQHDELVSVRFAILCSGFVSPAVEHQQLMSTSTIDCPSLHIFGGSSGHDRQIGVHDSEELASLFRSDKRMIVRHNMGHIIPTQPECVQQYLEFLSQFKS
ncbi:unnamed protein product [Calypogeia fissa]